MRIGVGLFAYIGILPPVSFRGGSFGVYIKARNFDSLLLTSVMPTRSLPERWLGRLLCANTKWMAGLRRP
jgi:hypothetical protein